MTVPVEALCHHAHANDMIIDMRDREVGIGPGHGRSSFDHVDDVAMCLHKTPPDARF